VLSSNGLPLRLMKDAFNLYQMKTSYERICAPS